ncbi:hypothetical protein [Phormidium sp. CCY1219]|uniref:hypothetical protein n=1 Tax=Phormidium sp. CCY1219 TaxID=2886104 RepID=UPI002D1F67A9|nr:hypothetical protein [Phormidium sp. CCY1219]MEB3831549.1 hypothetical protein [Phormidium sp. CCY1219]
MMLSQNQHDVRQIADKILTSRRITRKDQSLLMSVVLNNTLNPQEKHRVDKIYDDLHKGLIRVVD